jgi:hypothetical protein
MQARKQGFGWVVALFILAIGVTLFLRMGLVESYDTTTLNTQVNITSSPASVSSIAVNAGASVNLSEGTTRSVLCNATITDYQGQPDIDKVNATFFRSNESVFGAQDNNTRYTNSSCTYEYAADSLNFVYYCTFDVVYYAYNGSWNCSVFVNSTLNFTNNMTLQTTIFPLYAINVNSTIDFGNLSVFDSSTAIPVDVTNFGNQRLNLSVYGYGGTSNATGGGKAFNCPSGSNISIDNLRYSLDGSLAWAEMTNLTSGARLVQNVSLEKQMADVAIINTTYWKLYVPPNPFGLCNGTIVYDASAG